MKKYLSIWQLNSLGQSIPISYKQLTSEIVKINSCERSPREIIRALEKEELIEVTPLGERILTAKGLAERPTIEKQTVIPLSQSKEETSTAREAAWLKFRNVCNYYIDCVHFSEKTQEYLYLNELNNKFFLPPLEIGWLFLEKEFKLPFTKKQSVTVNALKSRKDGDEEVYIGYPLSRFKCQNGSLAFSPIFLIPIDINFDILNVTAKINREGIDINRTWLEFNVSRNEQIQCLKTICYNDGPNTGCVDLKTALQYISNKFKIELNYNSLDYDIGKDEKGIVNAAAVFIGSGLKYSKTLKRELKFISKQPAEVLDRTALAYVFRTPVLENKYEIENFKRALSFIPSNGEQIKAIEESLNKPVSRVIGPPGTGKSQVAVNIIANSVYYGKSVLFTSKNHKAIHAISDKGTSASPKFPFIQFCSKPDGTPGTEWAKTDIDQLFGDCERIKMDMDTEEKSSSEQILNAIDMLSDSVPYIEERNKIVKDIELLQAERDENSRNLTLENNTADCNFENKLKKLLAVIQEPNDPNNLWTKILEFLFRKESKRCIAENEIRILFPNISKECRSRNSLKNRITRFLPYLAREIGIQKELDECIAKAKTYTEYDSIYELFSKAQGIIKKNITSAFMLKNFERIENAGNTIDISRLKNSARRLARQNLPFLTEIIGDKEQTEAKDAFINYSKLFPAWAVTLLSLTKASPCIAGMFDRVVIDEAAQCEVPPIIPALFRAKGVTVIGDPNQFPPVITMRENRNGYLRYIKNKLVNLEDERYDFLKQTAYGIVEQSPVMLREHFRCDENIAEYFNEEYYGSNLKVMTNNTSHNFPYNMGFKRGIEWIDVSNSIENEKSEVVKIFDSLVKNDYQGTVGVISPFRQYANDLKTILHKYEPKLKGFSLDSVSTVNGFQGGEKDLIIFMLGLTDSLTNGQEWYAEANENRYIYNVAVSRAKICFIIVGDRNKARMSSASPLRKLADPPTPKRVKFDSPLEKQMFNALVKEGITPVSQYPLAGRYLDLALPDVKLDIEIDGVRYHTNESGERNLDDTYRDLTIESVGWKVMRFWSYEITDDIQACIEKIKTYVTDNS